MTTAYTCGTSQTCLTGSSCDLNLDFLDDGSLTIYELLCKALETFQEALDGLGGLDEALALKEDIAYLTDVRKLSLEGDFTGTWYGETLQEVKDAIQADIDAIQLQIDALVAEDTRIENKFDGEVTRIDGELATKENSIDITNNRLLDTNGNFTGTWENESYTDFKQQITNGETLYQNVIDLINANPNIGIEVIDGEFLATAGSPTEDDMGLVTDVVTEEIDAGLVLYPCGCSA